MLITNQEFADRSVIVEYYREIQMTELALPRRIVEVKELPLLGTGKTDYQKAKALALEEVSDQKSLL